MSKKVLVIGGAGFIGSHTVDALVSIGLDVVILDSLDKKIHAGNKPDYLNNKAEFIIGDKRDKALLSHCLKDVSYVYDFAAYQDYMTDFSEFFSVNAVGTSLLYEVIVEKKLPVEKVIVAASQFVQGEGVYEDSDGNYYSPRARRKSDLEQGQWGFYNESGEKLQWSWTTESHSKPTNAYSISKKAQEDISLSLGRQYDVPSVVLRYSIVQGSRQSFLNTYSGACRIFCLCYANDKPAVVYEDGKMCRDFVNIYDVVNANLLVLNEDRAIGELFNVGGGKAYTILEFAEAVGKCFGKEHIEPLVPGQYRLGDTRNSCSDITKIKGLMWNPAHSIIDSIMDYIEYLKYSKVPDGLLEESMERMRDMGVVRAVR